jgi:hypothetical protein
MSQEGRAATSDPAWVDAELRRLNGTNVLEGQGEAIDEDGVDMVDEGAERAEADALSD